MAASSFIFFAILLLISSGRGNADEINDKAASGMNNFGIKMYKELIKNNDKNIFCSGFSVSVLLNMLLAGARTQTATEISKALGNQDTGLTQNEMDNWIHEILTQQRGDHPGYELDIANGMWIHEGYHVLPEFKSKLLDTFYAEEDEVTFGTQEATDKINSWVNKATKSKIPKLFAGRLDALVRLVLVNAMYFNGTWETKFDHDLTEGHTFHYNDGESTKDIEMMNIVKKFRYAESKELNSQLLELPYVGDEVSMIVVLPHENNGLNDLEKILTFETLKRAFKEMDENEVHVKLPKFTTTSTLPLVEILRRMGIEKSFMEGVADLSGIDGTQELYASKAIQKAVVEVSEEGTKAVAVSAVEASVRTSAPKQNEFFFTADHPFIYFIRHNPSGILLFMGRYVEP